MPKRYTITKVLFYLIVFMTIYPVIMGASGITLEKTPFSIFNNNDDGLSYLATNLEDLNYDITVILSSLKILRSINRTGLLIIMAPTIKYDFQEALAVIDFLYRGGSVLIVDDFYVANSLLNNIWFILKLAVGGLWHENVSFEGFFFNTTAVLMDAGSYYKTPANPVIQRFNDFYGILSQEVSSVITNFPSVISVKLRVKQKDGFKEIVTALPSVVGLLSSTEYSWLETDLKSARLGKAKPDPWEWGGISFSLGFVVELPTGGKFAMISDPDIFSNGLLKLKEFDNLEFALSLIEWLVKDIENPIIIFDEAHLPHIILDPLFGLSLWFRALTEVSSSWIVAPFVPFLFIVILLGYIPRLSKFQPRLFSRVERTTGMSWAKSRIKWYLKLKNYRYAGSILMDSLIKDIVKRYGIREGSWQEIVEELLGRRSDLAAYRSQIWAFMNTLHSIVQKKKKIKREDFLKIIDEYKKIRELLLS